MPSPDIYVQVTVTPHDRESGRRSDSPQTVIAEVPGARIKRYRDQSPYAGEATDEQLAEYLAGEIAPHALARAVSTNPGARVSIPSHFPNARVRSKRVSSILVMTACGHGCRHASLSFRNSPTQEEELIRALSHPGKT